MYVHTACVHVEVRGQLLLFIYHVRPGYQTQIVPLDGKHLYVLSHLASPRVSMAMHHMCA